MTEVTAETRVRCRAILIVEDDPDIRETLRDAISLEGYTVEAAQNGQDALDRLAVIARPCLILLDLMMPVMDGIQFLSHLRADDLLMTTPVVMVTAYEAMAREKAVTAAGIVRKPIDFDRLLEYVVRFCGPADPTAA